MSSNVAQRPPAPVVVAMVIHALAAAVLLVTGAVVAIAGGEPAWMPFSLVALLPGAVALGLWQGNRGARIVAITAASPSLVGTVVMVLPLAVSQSSRHWFTPDNPDTPGAYAFLDESGDD